MSDEEDLLVALSYSDISKLKVPDLKKALKLRGLSTGGNKKDLVDRLSAASNHSSTIGHSNTIGSVDDLEEDLLNDDDDTEHDENESVIHALDNELILNDSLSSKGSKRKSIEDNGDAKNESPKKFILNRTLSKQPIESPVTAKPAVVHEEDASLSEDKKVVKLSELSAKERLEMRAKKFGVNVATDTVKKAARAERFGGAQITMKTSSSSSIKGNPVETNIDVLKQRAERFGGSVSKSMSKMETQDKLDKRKARFGVTAETKSTNGTNTDVSNSNADKAKQRLERFKPIVL